MWARALRRQGVALAAGGVGLLSSLRGQSRPCFNAPSPAADPPPDDGAPNLTWVRERKSTDELLFRAINCKPPDETLYTPEWLTMTHNLAQLNNCPKEYYRKHVKDFAIISRPLKSMGNQFSRAAEHPGSTTDHSGSDDVPPPGASQGTHNVP